MSLLPRETSGVDAILYAEDHLDSREATTRFLEYAGYNVVAASDGKEALNRYVAEPWRYNLVLTDGIMPRMNGHELAARLRDEGYMGKIVLYSGSDVPPESRPHFDLVLTKPAQDLMGKIRELYPPPLRKAS